MTIQMKRDIHDSKMNVDCFFFVTQKIVSRIPRKQEFFTKEKKVATGTMNVTPALSQN